MQGQNTKLYRVEAKVKAKSLTNDSNFVKLHILEIKTKSCSEEKMFRQ